MTWQIFQVTGKCVVGQMTAIVLIPVGKLNGLKPHDSSFKSSQVLGWLSQAQNRPSQPWEDSFDTFRPLSWRNKILSRLGGALPGPKWDFSSDGAMWSIQKFGTISEGLRVRKRGNTTRFPPLMYATGVSYRKKWKNLAKYRYFALF